MQKNIIIEEYYRITLEDITNKEYYIGNIITETYKEHYNPLTARTQEILIAPLLPTSAQKMYLHWSRPSNPCTFSCDFHPVWSSVVNRQGAKSPQVTLRAKTFNISSL
jgi:hypothetical protein